VATNVATSLLYVELALTSHADESGDLYLVLMGWSVLIAAGYFLQRVFQPMASVRLAGHGAALGRDRAVRITRLLLWACALWFAGAVAAVAAVDARLALLVGLVVSRAPLYLAMAYAVFLLENSGDRHLRTTAVAGAAALAAVALAGAILIPLFGAVGAICALAVKEPVLALTVLRGRTGAPEESV
jgi:hypothetical protein